ncbi:DNA-processing protein DprA [Candidatus Planktophila versatilis]|uniref:DNA-processing protein DprA n=1 Tax=Candidatus Planktophila versatilis TaxID=1884905 RepID=UPI000BACB52C|nr:DNA-processing protein DprA [Candidatus Planktophila versatilis]ASY26240.1 DNA processing protein [Candidatus Planktophila versatilis]
MRLLTDDVKIQRLALFNAIEAGNTYWARQVNEFGIAMVYEHLALGVYDATKYGAITQSISAFNADEALAVITQSGGVFITPEDLSWPTRVNQLAIPPLGLIVKGDLSILNNPSLAIVGTRNPTPYGVRLAGDFAAGFVDREWDIISGGAYGIDTAAHRGALVAEGRTIAVIASGIDVQYPAGNARLFDEICENGAIISEVMPGVTAMPHRFLIRNRLIAALSLSTLVVEAAFRSGSLRTARDAAELMRPVMAIPGPISSPSSEGCHRLIGERAAELVTSVADAMELISAL